MGHPAYEQLHKSLDESVYRTRQLTQIPLQNLLRTFLDQFLDCLEVHFE